MTARRGPAGAGLASLRRIGAFLLLFTVLQGLYGAAAGSWVERLVIDEATVKVAAALIRIADPEVGVVASGPSLKAPGGGLNVRNGCEGVDVAFLLASAMLVAPLAWRARLAGLAAALALTFVLNQGRVVALFYAYRLDRTWFDALHGYIGPLVLVAVAGLFFTFWVRRFGADGAGPAGAR